jgi:hypothetical protein
MALPLHCGGGSATLVAMQAVVETPDYLRDARAAGIGDDERRSIVDYVAASPRAGDLIVGSGGARKIRFAAPGRGKSGGYRVVTYYGGDDLPVFLLNVFKKGDRVNLSARRRSTRCVRSFPISHASIVEE